ncbi:hypothetical protein [Mycolicibacterium fluoranthenivorans]|uniref:Uncharacterized protein n=1 Tax=Mycolicibacterium fluoranthenivorans TaxID=258505 RepID=A0A1G4X0E8_9MYCO|nr:hypothetical protein [Mycolicibacterium fluoranthenivorans]SCX32933.1 hypothetical protein SAMN02799620_05750 [Mycolicibacterium fluoranthenivorans]
MRMATEARELLKALDAELEDAGKSAGETLFWSAEEAELRKFIGDAVTRKCALARAFDKATSASARLTFSAEIRLLETHISKMLKELRSGMPDEQQSAPSTVTSMKASHAANSRWKRERLASGGQ